MVEKFVKNTKKYNERDCETRTKDEKRELIVTQDNFINEFLVKIEKCDECKYKLECPGIWKEYLRKFGKKEFFADEF